MSALCLDQQACGLSGSVNFGLAATILTGSLRGSLDSAPDIRPEKHLQYMGRT
jgi:hypothetical protein